MHLYDVPLAFALVGLVLYTVLAGADFGAGAWRLLAGRGGVGERIRDHAHHSMGPVWEANHVWLIFVLTVMWTAYPAAFGSIASTLSVPLLLAAIGIIVRGAAYALRTGAQTPRELRAIDGVSAISSIVTPFALGAAVGGIASRRVPVGNATGQLFSSWLNPTSGLIGGLAIATSAYLAAVYLAADAERIGERELAQAFRARALAAGIAAGAVALGGLAVLHADAHPLYRALIRGSALGALISSIVAGCLTLMLVWRRRFEAARYTAALAVAAIIAGWGLAQHPLLLPGLTVAQAAAPHDTLIAIVVVVIAGGALLFPSLGLLFGLLLSGRLDRDRAQAPSGPTGRALLAASAAGLLGRGAAVALVMGVGFLTIAEAPWAHIIGVVSLCAFIVLGFAALAPTDAGLPED
ncbi:MAG: cytochrome d ubiquinol oxidase subunit II [Actinobacteria bacterium]|nr:MAG: cytochrome d ubiquinol oxidase subunit II [Actinomycetota bacterium]